ncbi:MULTISPECIES: XkdQ/YqbQ family protein [Caproicibacterium]|uniref:YqbQ/XkdQ domain-containing protein n=1 Tax=Caproicibacterium argilliputei TaxID=3030016 RepID=A0AA97DA93_9FIRM|nr:hypothetical protein [Caproicibacterium argilliputei]WOC33485.1 hypothetical protein PXC00_06355 [Caproicibacterium argilliputei]
MSIAVSPQYTLFLQKGGKTYQLLKACSAATLSEKTDSLAQTLTFTVASVKAGNAYIGSIIDPGDIVHLTCNDGDRKGELFKGPVWEVNYSQDARSISYTAYDPLIYIQKSSDALFFPVGRTTQQIFQSICSKWKIPLQYKYTGGIKHEKKSWTNNKVSDMMLELLKDAKKKSKVSYMMKWQAGYLLVANRGINKIVYSFSDSTNLTKASSKRSMENVVTQIIITGSAKDSGQIPIKATVKGTYQNRYGVLQNVQEMKEKQSLADAKSDATKDLWENRQPTLTFTGESVDYPFLRKGDLVNFLSGANGGYKKISVSSVSHNLLGRTMALELEL